MIFSIFIGIEAKKSTRKDEDQRLFRKKRLPIGRNSSAGTFSRSSLQFNSPSRYSNSHSNSNSHGMSSALSLGGLGLSTPKKTKMTHTPSKPKISSAPKYSGAISNGPRRPRGYAGPRYVGGPRRAYGYYRGGFPVWLTSYAIIMNTLEECPAYHEANQYAQKTEGLCLMMCDKLHCIQTLNFCCYYVEPEKYLVVAAKK